MKSMLLQKQNKTLSNQVFTSKQEGVPCIYNLDNYVTEREHNILIKKVPKNFMASPANFQYVFFFGLLDSHTPVWLFPGKGQPWRELIIPELLTIWGREPRNLT